MTLVEMLMATGIMGILATTMAAMSIAVDQSASYNYGRSTAAQHARVALQRIDRMVSTATSASGYPGVAVVSAQVGSYLFPDTLVVWQPGAAPANPAGPPLVKEVIFYCTDPSNPSQLVEITAPNDTRTIPMDSATLSSSTWQSTIAGITTASTSRKTVLTNLLRTAAVSGSGTNSTRGAVRFYCDLHATAAEWSAYQGGTLTWTNIAWPQGLYSASAALRQAWVHTELQLMPVQMAGQQDPSGQLPMIFFGSSALYYQVSP